MSEDQNEDSADPKGGRGLLGSPPDCRDASSAGGADRSCGASGAEAQVDEPVLDRAAYVQAVLELYLALPGTSRVTSRHDRRCVKRLFEQGVPLRIVRAALIIGVARRTFRGGEPLARVRALHYFLPLVDEVRQGGRTPCDPGYLSYLESKLRPLMLEKARGQEPSQRLSTSFTT